MRKSEMYNLLGFMAIAGNIIFILWMTYNGIDERFQGNPTGPEIASYIGLTILLILNSFLIYNFKRKS